MEERIKELERRVEQLERELRYYFYPDATEEGQSLKDLLGMEVVSIGGSEVKCEGCPMDHYEAPCVKVELVGGDYLCLAKPKQMPSWEELKKTWLPIDKLKEKVDAARPVIRFDVEEESQADALAGIKEKTEEFMDYLDSLFDNKEQ